MLVKGRESVIKFGTYNYVPTIADNTDDSLNCMEISNVFPVDEDVLFVPTQLDVEDLLESLSKQGKVDDIVAANK